jgi:hypothetical protein
MAVPWQEMMSIMPSVWVMLELTVCSSDLHFGR